MRKLEKHTEHLELTVSQRTAELEGEKQKTEQLVYRMLPRYLQYWSVEYFHEKLSSIEKNSQQTRFSMQKI